jgi:hypothetical protein
MTRGGRWGFVGAVTLVTLVALTAAPRAAQAQRCGDSGRLVPLPVLWSEPELPPGASDAGAALRGWNDGFTVRPGREINERATDAWPWLLPEGDDGPLTLRLSEAFAAGPLLGENVDRAELVAAYPATRPEDLLGGTRRYWHRARAVAYGALVRRCLSVYAEAIDARDATTQLGAGGEERASAPRLTLNLSLRPSPRLWLSLGGRYDALAIADAGLSAWHRPSAARDRDARQAVVVAALRFQPTPRLELGLTADLTWTADDWRAQNGLRTPGHINLDSYDSFGNAPFTERERHTRVRADLGLRWFGDGVPLAGAAHTLRVGVTVERQTSALDDNRNGGFTFADVLPTDASGGIIDAFDEADRSTWRLFSSDRGDELHAKPRQTQAALYLEDRFTWDSRVAITPGLRAEIFRGGFAEAGTVWSTASLQPRLAVDVWPSEGQRTALWLRAGRHAQSLRPRHYLRARQGAAYSPLEYWDWTGDPLAPIDPGQDDPAWQRAAHFDPVLGDLAELEHPIVDRIAAGLSHRFATWDLGVGARGEWRRYRHMVALVDDSFEDGGFTRRTTSIGPGQYDTFEYYERAPGTAPRYGIRNPAAAERRFVSLTGDVDLAPTTWLSLAGQVVLAWDRGNLEADDGASEEWRDPSGTLGAYGDLATVDRVRATARSRLALPFRVDAGLDVTYASGRPYSRVLRIQPQGAPRFYVYDGKGRGGYLLPARILVDVFLERPLPTPGPGRWRAWLDVRNLLDAGTVTSLRETTTSFRGVRRIEAPFQAVIGVEYAY